MKSGHCEIEATAILVTTDGTNKVWLPFARIDLRHRGKVNEYVIIMPEALAVEKGLV